MQNALKKVLILGLVASTLGCANPASETPKVKTPASSKALTAFGLVNPATTGTINESAKTIALSVPAGTTVTSLVATFTTTGTKVSVLTLSPASNASVSSRAVKVEVTQGTYVDQVSGTTANDFKSPVTYRVTAEDGSTSDYTVTVTVQSVPPLVAS